MKLLIMTLCTTIYIGYGKEDSTNAIKNFDITTYARSADIRFSCLGCINFEEEILIEMACLNDWCNRKFSRYVCKEQFFKINDLTPFTNYSVNIKICETNLSCTKADETKYVQTEPAAPKFVEELDVYSKNENSISLRWKPPYPPTGELEHYQVHYSVDDEGSIVSEKIRNISIIPCLLWTDHHCLTLTGLKSKRNYSVTLRARNKAVRSFGRAKEINAITQKEPSEAPYDLKTSWSQDNSLRLNWKHPNRTNGDIKYFNITLYRNQDQNKSFIKYISEYTLWYTYEIKAIELSTSVEYEVRINAFNGFSGKELLGKILKPFDATENKIEVQNNSSSEYYEQGVSLNATDDVATESHYKQNSSPDYNALENFTKIESNAYNGSTYSPDNNNNFRNTNNIYNSSYEEAQANSVSNSFNNSKNLIIENKDTDDDDDIYEHQSNNQNLKNYTQRKVNFRFINVPVALSILLLLTITTMFILFLWILRRKSSSKSYKCIPYEEIMLNSTDSSNSGPVIENIVDELSRNQIDQDITKNKENETLFSKPIELGNFQKYVEMSERNGNFEHEFKMFVEKKSKTVYESLSNRLCEYIDFVHSDGTRIPKAYVACEIPKATGVHHFWRQIWEDNIEFLVLLGEVGPEQFHYQYQQYWPEEDEKIVYHGISVRLVSSKRYSSYTIRKFILVEDDVIKQVTQIHCPYCGVNPEKLAPLFRKMLLLSSKSTSSTLVHSSTGIGGAGVFLLCIITLRLAENEQTIDVLKSMDMLRKWKSGFIRNIEQYKLVYLIISHVLFDYEDLDSNEYANF